MKKPLGRIPLPFELISNAPAWGMADEIVRGAVISILEAWWVASCPQLPQPGQLKTIARMHDSRWNRYQGRILAFLSEVVPQLTNERRRREEKRRNASKQTEKARNAALRKRLLQKQQQNRQTTFSDNTNVMYGDGQSFNPISKKPAWGANSCLNVAVKKDASKPSSEGWLRG